MAFRNFTTGFVIRIILLLVFTYFSGATLSLIGQKDLFFLPLILLLILILISIEFIIYTHRTNQNLARFILHLKNADLSFKFNKEKTGKPYAELYAAFEELTKMIKDIKIEREAQFNYLETIVGHINIGIISLKNNNEIEMINQPAKKILGVAHYDSWGDIADRVPEFTDQVSKIKGGGSQLVDFISGKDLKRLSVRISTVVILNEEFRIITFQDIRAEIDYKEVEAWHKLIRILRHEIMNSVTPVSSMTETILMLVEDHLGQPKKSTDLSDDDIRDILASIKTIHERSEGLYEFVEKYREISKIPLPDKVPIAVGEMVNNIVKLFENDLSAEEIDIDVLPENPTMTIMADKHLIEQVLINLIKNSIEALSNEEKKSIKISSEESDSIKLIRVTDNGCGIEKEHMDELYIPFFSTKESGSGIGLTLSKQIMQLHGGNIIAESSPGEETTFSLIFYID
jgi:nitrogen fixation/metabolism regulation signal transduction histidine kinase